jgi:quinol monooxygenase YgiN
MPNLTIVADIIAKPNQVDFLKSELEKLINATRQEAGCVQYDLHQDNNDPAHFLFFENWESRDHWQTHMNSPHLLQYKAATENAVDSVVISEMTKTNG